MTMYYLHKLYFVNVFFVFVIDKLIVCIIFVNDTYCINRWKSDD